MSGHRELCNIFRACPIIDVVAVHHPEKELIVFYRASAVIGNHMANAVTYSMCLFLLLQMK